MLLYYSDREHHTVLLALPHGHTHKTGDTRLARGHSILRIQRGFLSLPTPASHRNHKHCECASLVFSVHTTFSTPKAFHFPSRAVNTLKWMLFLRELSSGAPQQGAEKAGTRVIFQFLFDFLLLCIYPWGYMYTVVCVEPRRKPCVERLLPTSHRSQR